ncbi:MAG TPA: hypothetical protein VJ724_08875 [Tahibacter sp.]|nr:hypothetical protein [Tahibacter sp.]
MHLRLYGIAAFAMLFAGCAVRASDDFDVSTTITQNVALRGLKSVVVRCYCPKRDIRHDAKHDDLRLQIHGNYSSVGYHGNQEKPTSVPREQLAFVEQWGANSLTLVSHEQTYIHHALIVVDLDIEAPAGVDVRIEPIPADELEGRRIDAQAIDTDQ